MDRNRYKGLCKTKADSDGIRTARLPIGDYIKLLTAPVMTVNHVRHFLMGHKSKHSCCGRWSLLRAKADTHAARCSWTACCLMDCLPVKASCRSTNILTETVWPHELNLGCIEAQNLALL